MTRSSRKREHPHDDTNSSDDNSVIRVSSNSQESYGVVDNRPLTLEKLPENNLKSIFEHLNPTELLNVCKISRNLYLPAAICLYKRIIITNAKSKYVRADVETWVSRKCTVTCNPKALVESVSHKKTLASLVETIIIHKEENRLWLPLISLCGNLKVFHNRGDEVCDEAICSKLFGATCHVKKLPIFGPNLTELRLVYACDEQSMESFKKIALSMIRTRAYIHLKALIIDHEIPRRYGLRFKWTNQRAGYPCWIRFFQVFGAKKIRLNLETLGLDGYFETEAEAIATSVLLAIQPSKLKTLELRYNEDPHPGFLHRPFETDYFATGFLQFLTVDTKSLVNLFVDQKINCAVCEQQFLKDATEYTLKDQLKHLSFQVPLIAEFNWVLQMLTDFQASLSKLDTQHGYLRHKQCPPHWSGIVSASEEHLNIKFRRHCYSPWFNFTQHCHPFASAEAEKHLRQNLNSLARLLRINHVYSHRYAYQPQLNEYCIDGFHVDLKNNRLLLNGDWIDLDPYDLQPQNRYCRGRNRY